MPTVTKYLSLFHMLYAQLLVQSCLLLALLHLKKGSSHIPAEHLLHLAGQAHLDRKQIAFQRLAVTANPV